MIIIYLVNSYFSLPCEIHFFLAFTARLRDLLILLIATGIHGDDELFRFAVVEYDETVWLSMKRKNGFLLHLLCSALFVSLMFIAHLV